MIRRAAAADVPAIRAVAEAAYAAYVPALGRKPAPMVADFAALVAGSVVEVAEQSGEVVGFVVLFPKDGAMFVENVAVRPGLQGSGIGRRLMAFAEERARTAGLDRLELYTNVVMEGPQRLYPGLGYRETGRRSEDGFDRIFYEKRLAEGA